jgi:hypothetical protein
MKIKMTRDVYSGPGWRKEGDVIDLDPKIAKHYIRKGIAIEYKEEKAAKETKEAKAPKKRVTKSKK